MITDFQRGRKVFATTKIVADENTNGPEVVAAIAGDEGTVLDPCCDNWANVQFTRTGAVTICHVSEISFSPPVLA